MKLIVGLGNPGSVYINSRHNIGFSVIKAIAKKNKVEFRKDRGISSLSGKLKIKDTQVLLILPLSYMNLSGISVSSLVKKNKIDLEDLLVVCDDLNLDFGRLKIRPRGSSGGHRGLESLIENLKSADFARLRVGIGRPGMNIDASEYVLGNFKRKEKEELKGVISRACDCCLRWAESGLQESMNIFNQRNS